MMHMYMCWINEHVLYYKVLNVVHNVVNITLDSGINCQLGNSGQITLYMLYNGVRLQCINSLVPCH